MFARVQTWWMIFRISLEERMVYRGDFMLGTFMRFLPIVTQIFLWWAVFESIGGGTLEGASIGKYNFESMVAYYLLTMISRAFSSMPGLSSSIAAQVRDGEIKKFLIQPVDLIGFLLLQRVAHKLTYYIIATIPFAVLFFLCRGYFVEGWPPLQVIAGFIASLMMGFLLGYFLETCIGLIAFWFLDVTSLLFIYMLLSFFLSGHMFPLELLPDNIQFGVNLMPLKYLAYFPAAVFLGKVNGDELVNGLLMEVAWIGFFIILSRVMFHFGVKRYSGFGG